MSKLPGYLIDRMMTALVDGFPRYEDLYQMVRIQMGENLEAVAGKGRLKDVAFDLIIWADSEEKVGDLVLAATAANPNNEFILQMEEDYQKFLKRGTLSKQKETLPSPSSDMAKLKVLIVNGALKNAPLSELTEDILAYLLKHPDDYEVAENELIQFCLSHLETTDGSARQFYLDLIYWLKGEKILVIPRQQCGAYAELTKDPQKADKYFVSTRAEGIDLRLTDTLGNEIQGIKLEIVSKSGLDTSRYISLVAQVIFVVNFPADRAEETDLSLLTLHDRSYTGAGDQLDRYALITGRLSLGDLLRGGSKVQLSTIYTNTLLRELQECEELNLDGETARKYLEKARLLGMFSDSHGPDIERFSFLYRIPIAFDEFKNLIQRGPYLRLVTLRAYSYLKQLGLLNHILNANSCPNCPFTTHRTCSFTRADCIISRAMDRQPLDDKHEVLFSKFWEKPLAKNIIKHCYNSIYIAIDIYGYSQLSTTEMLEIRNQFQRIMQSFLPIPNFVETTPSGYIVVLNQKLLNHPYLALLAYFFAIYLEYQFWSLRNFYEAQSINTSIWAIRIALHADDLPDNIDNQGFAYYSDGMNNINQIIQFCAENHIITSQNFLLEMMDEFSSRMGETIEVKSEVMSKERTVSLKIKGQSEWRAKETLGKLKLPPLVIKQFIDWESPLPFLESMDKNGILFKDLGAFVDEQTTRHRLFSFLDPGFLNPRQEGMVQSSPHEKPYPKIGNLNPPVFKVPFILRNGHTTGMVRSKLIDSFRDVEYLTIYGYSNINVLKDIHQRLECEADYLSKLRDFKVIFRSFDHIRHITEVKSIAVARADWICGFLYANQIARTLSERSQKPNVAIIINNIYYGFNVLKAIFSSTSTYRDYIRFTIPMPGSSFEVSPLFNIYRGDTLFHDYLELCENYIESYSEKRLQTQHTVQISEFSPLPRQNEDNRREEILRWFFSNENGKLGEQYNNWDQTKFVKEAFFQAANRRTSPEKQIAEGLQNTRKFTEGWYKFFGTFEGGFDRYVPVDGSSLSDQQKHYAEQFAKCLSLLESFGFDFENQDPFQALESHPNFLSLLNDFRK